MRYCCGKPAALSSSAGCCVPEFLGTYLALQFLPVTSDRGLTFRFGVSPAVISSGAYGHRDRRTSTVKCLLWTLCFLIMTCSSAMARPTWSRSHTSAKPRWVNPCDLPGHVFDPSTDMEGAPPISLKELYSNIKERSRVAKEHASHVKEHFLKMTFNDPDFVPGTGSHRQSWLPKIPTSKEQYFSSITKEEAFRKSFEMLQYFAVGIEQIILDQVIYDGSFINQFRDVENHLTQVLCELQLGIFSLRIPTSPDVMRNVMSQEYRDIPGKSLRNVRDYLILRDYVKATQFVSELFTYLERTLWRKK